MVAPVQVTEASNTVPEGRVLELSPTDRRRLLDVVNSPSSPSRTIRRAKILLFLDSGLSTAEISKRLGIVRASVHNCRRRYMQDGIERAIHDGARPGGPRRITDEAVEWMRSVVSRDPQSLGLNIKRWTVSALQEYIQNNAQANGFPVLSSISRSRLWSLTVNTGDSSSRTADQPVPQRRFIWTEFSVPIEAGSDCFWHVALKDKSEDETSTSQCPHLKFAVAIDLTSSAVLIRYLGNPARPALLDLLHLLDEVVNPESVITLYSMCNDVFSPEIMGFVQSRPSRFALSTLDEYADVSRTAFCFMQACANLLIEDLAEPSADGLGLKIEEKIFGFRPPLIHAS